MAVVALTVFLLLRFTTGDPAAIIAGDNATSQDVAAIRTKLGLDRPVAQQFVIWIGNVLRGDFGESFFFKKPVAELIVGRLQPTLALATCTLLLAVSMAVPLGVVAAWRRGTWIDRVVMGFSVMGFSVPTFVIGYVLIYLIAIQLGWLPVQGYQRLEEGFGGFIERLILPSFTLAVIYVALIARITRASVLEVLNADYVRTARAKGLPERKVQMRHAFRNALIPLTTVVALNFGALIGGAIITETVFSLDGMGLYFVNALGTADPYPVMAWLMITAILVIFFNLVADIAYGVLDPRIRYD
jgi:peptide/nickel transport system permease protein